MATPSSQISVEVLLATFNGAKYLAEQLDSLLAQTGVEISLIVSDDGSKDQTLEILDKYKDFFSNFIILHGPGRGPQANFFFLLQNSRGAYVALCDQDDIWESNHLLSSVNRLDPDKPEVTCSVVREFTASPQNYSAIWPKKIKIDNIERILFENLVRGCTIVMNRLFVDVLVSNQPADSVMHDWWIALLAKGKDCLIFSPIPEVNYRIHEGNAVGKSPSFLTKFRRFLTILTNGYLPTLSQLREFLLLHTSDITGETIELLMKWQKPITLKKLFWQIFGRSRYRSNTFEELVIRLTFIWVWVREGVNSRW
jgi:glycosyltransferase involved in cell wall biosynthesis